MASIAARSSEASVQPTNSLAAVSTARSARREVLQPPEGLEPNRKLRIAAIGLRGVPSNYSGLETSAQSLYRDLARRGHEITVYSRKRYVERPEEHYHGIHRLNLPPIYLKSVETLSHIGLSLAHALTRGDYDVLHLHALAPGLGAWIRRFSQIPIVSTVQGLDWQRAKWRGAGAKALRSAERLLARHADEMIVVSQELQEYFQRQYQRPTTHIPNGVERLFVSQDHDLLASFGLEAERYVVFIGRLVPEKRVEDLIAAFRSMPPSYKL
ncbi:MAG: glycosyltransferase family 4 protein, partial [Acidobacteriota bacterium]